MPERQTESPIKTALREAFGAEERLSDMYEDETIVAMNGLAEAITTHGPTTDLSAFLFAMHGERWRIFEPSDTAQAYESMRETFDLSRLETLFTYNRRGPYPEDRASFVPRSLVSGYRDGDSHKGGFSAVHFDVRRLDQGGFEGAAFVPVVYDEAPFFENTGRISLGYVMLGKTSRGVEGASADVPEFNPGLVQFGANLLPMTPRFDEGLTNILEKEKTLREFSIQEGAPDNIPSPYRQPTV